MVEMEEVIPVCVSLLEGRIPRMKRQGSGCVVRIVLWKQFGCSCRLQVEGSVALFQSPKNVWKNESNGLEVFPKACAECDKYMRLHQ